jgi:hypothetical protein
MVEAASTASSEEKNVATDRPWWAVPVVVGCGLVVVGLNFFAAHYREVSNTSERFDEAQVIAHMRSAPFELSLASVVLLLIGILCAVLAAYKGYTSTDRYPGFEKIDRRRARAVEAWDDLAASIKGQLDAIAVSEVDALVNRRRAEQAMLGDIRQRHRGFLVSGERARRLDTSDVATAEAAVVHFRQLNLKVRTDGVVPAYFAEPTGLAEMIPKEHHGDLGAFLSEVASKQDEVKNALAGVVVGERERLERAKENTELIMSAIERAGAEQKDVPKLEEIRALLSTGHATASQKAGSGGV